MFGSLDPAKILVVLVIALIVLGPERLPRAARTLGAFWHEFTRIRQEVSDEVKAALPSPEDLPTLPRIPSVRGSLTRYLTDTGTEDSASNSAPRAGGGPANLPRPSALRVDEAVPADDPSMN